MSQERKVGKTISRVVINPALTKWLKAEFRVSALNEITRATYGEITFEPQVGTHIRVSAFSEDALKDFMNQFPTRRQRTAPYKRVGKG
ncbi:MAG: hypothetical protein Q8P25_03020 [Candidatus Curtissbacteria bacterium]|nr:hypothetical protein [Candidatus Curtissbacteria bacterium]MDZ4209588.1 hypothetical protein [Candidatus Curtissbacteria bacterium]